MHKKTTSHLSPYILAGLSDLQQRVEAAFPGVDMRWTLFGSQARGDAEPDSDVDLLLDLNLDHLTFQDKQAIRHLAGEVSLAHGLVLSVMAVDRSMLRTRGDYSIFANIRQEGIPL